MSSRWGLIIVPVVLNRRPREIRPTWTTREVVVSRLWYLHVDRHVVGDRDMLLRIPEGQRCPNSPLYMLE